MYYFIRGKVSFIDEKSIILENSGIGYQIFISVFSLGKVQLEEEITLYTHVIYTENSRDIYGFFTLLEKEVFNLLLSVSGVGAKLNIKIFAQQSAETVLNEIANGNELFFAGIKGLGKKTASRIIIECKKKAGDLILKNKIVPQLKNSSAKTLGLNQQILKAFSSLGYREKEIQNFISSSDGLADLSIEEIIRLGLAFFKKK